MLRCHGLNDRFLKPEATQLLSNLNCLSNFSAFQHLTLRFRSGVKYTGDSISSAVYELFEGIYKYTENEPYEVRDLTEPSELVKLCKLSERHASSKSKYGSSVPSVLSDLTDLAGFFGFPGPSGSYRIIRVVEENGYQVVRVL